MKKNLLITKDLTVKTNNSKTNNSKSDTCVHPWWITGITDGEGNFSINVNSKSNKITASYKVSQKTHSKWMLILVQKYFGCGNVVLDNKGNEAHKFVVSKTEDLLNIIIPHFDKYNLVTSKYLDYLDWKKAILLFKNQSRLKNKDQIVKLKEGMNKGRSFDSRWSRFNNIIPEIQPMWLQAFIDAEGSFQFNMSQTVNRKKPCRVANPTLEIGQNSHDVLVLAAIKRYFGLGCIKPSYDITSLEQAKKSRSLSRYVLTNSTKVIELVDRYPMFTRKKLDYEDWKELVWLKSIKAHHTSQGLLKMLKIKNGMNANRSPLLNDFKYFSTCAVTIYKDPTLSLELKTLEQNKNFTLNPLIMWIIFVLGIALWVVFISISTFGIPIWVLSFYYPEFSLIVNEVNASIIEEVNEIGNNSKIIQDTTIKPKNVYSFYLDNPKMFNRYYVKENNMKLDALINKFYQPNYRLSNIYRQSIEHLNSRGSTFSTRPNNAINVSQRVFFMVNSDIFNSGDTARTGVQATPATPSTPFTPRTFSVLQE